MSTKRSDIELLDDELLELVNDDDNDVTTAVTPQPHHLELEQELAPQAQAARPTRPRQQTRQLFTTEAELREQMPRSTQPRPATQPYGQQEPAPLFPPQPIAEAYPQPVAAPFTQPPQQMSPQPGLWAPEPIRHAPVPWSGAASPTGADTWHQQPQAQPQRRAKPRVMLHPAALFGVIAAALIVGVVMTVLILRPATEQQSVTAAPPATTPAPAAAQPTAQPVAPAAPTAAPTPIAAPIPAAVAADQAAAPAPAVEAAPSRAPATTSGVRSRSAQPSSRVAADVASRLAAAQPGLASKAAPEEQPSSTAPAAPAQEATERAKPERRTGKSKPVDPFAEEDSAPAEKPEKKPAKKGGWDDPFAE